MKVFIKEIYLASLNCLAFFFQQNKGKYFPCNLKSSVINKKNLSFNRGEGELHVIMLICLFILSYNFEFKNFAMTFYLKYLFDEKHDM